MPVGDLVSNLCRRGALCLIAGLALGLSPPVYAEEQRTSTVGMPARLDQVVLPGPELEVKPLTDPQVPIVLRIADVYPHGTAFRYDLVYYGLEPGTFDLKEYLRRKDGSSAADLPPLRVEIQPLLPPGQIEPHALESLPAPWLGGYRTWLVVSGVAWLAGLVAILFVGRRRSVAGGAKAGRPLTAADRLRPLVEGALAGRLSQVQLADLERTLLAYWRRRLRLQNEKPGEAIAVMRRHPEAGPLLEQLELWLHRSNAGSQVDVTALLQPYQNCPTEALEGPAT